MRFPFFKASKLRPFKSPDPLMAAAMLRSAPLALFSRLPGRCIGGNEDQQNRPHECPEGSSLPQIERREQNPKVGNKAARCRVEDRGRNDDKKKPSHDRSNDTPLPPIERAS